MDTISHELAVKGPWEGFHTCNVCCKVVEYDEYYRNSSVCPHCGVGGMGIVRSARRKVYRDHVCKPKLSWWHRLGVWCGVAELVVRRPFEWEIKES